MSKIIEAKAVISAADKTGNVFDQIAAKLKGVEKSAKSLENVKAPKFAGDLYKELERLKLSEKELQGVRKSYADFEKTMRSGGPLRASHYFRAMDEWKDKTVDHWRQVKAAVDDTEKAHKRFFKSAGYFALHAAGIGGAAYAAGHGIRSQVASLAERGRAQVRYEQMGLTSGQLGEANVLADSISSRFPSISRTEVLDDLRKNASRLGSFDRAKEIAETYARAKVSNKISGGDEHELEQVVRALEGMGKANSAEQLASGLNAFSKAKAANPDYSGEQFRTDMAAAAAAKYGLSKDYMENVFPILASHTTGFGNKLATGTSALVGDRMKKGARAQLEAAGLWKGGHLVDEKLWLENNYEWTQRHVRPMLEKGGIHFGEHMSDDDKARAVQATSRMFSAKNAQDLILTNLLDSTLVERARGRKTMGLEGVDDLQKKDPGLAWEGLKKQALDTGNALMSLKSSVDAMNWSADAFAKATKVLTEGKWPEGSPGESLQRLWNAPQGLDDINELHRRDNLRAQWTDWDSRLTGSDEDQSSAARTMRMKRFEAMEGYYASRMFADQNAPLLSDFKPLATGAMPGAQSMEGAVVQANVTGDVHGEAKLEVTVKPSQYFEALVQRVEQAIKLVGSLNSNGPGSTGASSPDAAAPAKPNTGAVAPPISH